MAQKRKQKRRRSKKWLYWLLMVLLFVGAVVICYFVWDVYFRVKDDVVKNSDDSGKNELVTEEKKEEDEKTKEEADKNDEQVIPEVVEKEKTIQYEGGDPNTSESLTGAITYAGVSGSEIMIRTNIDQYLTTGKCELVLERGGAVIYGTKLKIW